MPTISTSTAINIALPPSLMLCAVVVAFVASSCLCVWLIKCGPIDKSRKRGLHTKPTTTSAGMAIMAACAISMGLCAYFVLPKQAHGYYKDALILFTYAASQGLMGALDDWLGLSARLRLGVQIISALLFASLYNVTHIDFGLGISFDLIKPLGIIGTAMWLILGINTINFMDGANGLAAGSQALILAIIAMMIIYASQVTGDIYLTSGLLLLCLCALGAHLGFLPFNLPLNLAFQGDAGAFFAGALISGSVLILTSHNISSVWLGGYILAPLLVDVVLTLLMRFKNGEKLFESHNQHLYQQWLIKRDPSHFNMTIKVWILCIISGVVALIVKYILYKTAVDLRFTGMVLILSTYAIGWMMVHKTLTSLDDLTPQALERPK